MLQLSKKVWPSSQVSGHLEIWKVCLLQVLNRNSPLWLCQPDAPRTT